MNFCKFALQLTLIVFLANSYCSDNEANKKNSVKASIQSKKQLSQEKLQVVTALSVKLEEKKSKLAEAKQKFNSAIQSSADELNAENTKSNLQSFEQSMSNQKIANCLQFIQKASAYKELVENELQLTDNSLIELDATAKLLNLDLIMLDGMAEEKLEELLSKLDLTIKDITPQANELILPPDPGNKKPLETLYDEYVVKVRKQKELEAQKQAQEAELIKKQEELRIKEEERKKLILEPNRTMTFTDSTRPGRHKLRWCPDKNLLAVLDFPDLVIWDFGANSILKIPQNVVDAIWIPSGNGEQIILLTYSEDAEFKTYYSLKYWSVKTNALISERKLNEVGLSHDEQPYNKFIGWSGNFLALGGESSSFLIWDNWRKSIAKLVQADEFVWRDETSFFYVVGSVIYVFDLKTSNSWGLYNQCRDESDLIASRQCPDYIRLAWNKKNGLLAANMRYPQSAAPPKITIDFFNQEKKTRKTITLDEDVSDIWWSPTKPVLFALQAGLLTAINAISASKMGIAAIEIRASDQNPRYPHLIVRANTVYRSNTYYISECFENETEHFLYLKTEHVPLSFSWSTSGKRLAAVTQSGIVEWELGEYLK